MSLANTITVAPITFEKVTEGKYINAATSLDQPQYLEIKSQVAGDKQTSVVVKNQININNPVSGGSDLKLSVHTVIAFDPGFTVAQIDAALDTLAAFLNDNDRLTRMLRGER